MLFDELGNSSNEIYEYIIDSHLPSHFLGWQNGLYFGINKQGNKMTSGHECRVTARIEMQKYLNQNV
jgi:hypothetical protein